MQGDTIVRDDVIAELDFEPSLNHEGIGVAVKSGVVTLSGHVPSYWQKIAAEAAAKRVKGVRAVALELEVRLSDDAKHDDEEIATRAANIIAWGMPSEKISIVVDKGCVKLNGEVDWHYQRAEAERGIRRLSGVIGVIDLITVRATPHTRDIRKKISEAFRRNADLETGGIKIDIDGGAVTLSGHVRAWSERSIAENAVWATPGVTNVTDNLTVR